MIGFDLSHHAEARMRQRAIPPIIVAWILDYGRDMRHHGASVYFLNREARNKLKRDIGAKPYAQIENRLDPYVVVSDDGTIVTVGRRYKRLKRPGRRSCSRRSSHRQARRDRKQIRPASAT
jgi:hypothetical protein